MLSFSRNLWLTRVDSGIESGVSRVDFIRLTLNINSTFSLGTNWQFWRILEFQNYPNVKFVLSRLAKFSNFDEFGKFWQKTTDSSYLSKSSDWIKHQFHGIWLWQPSSILNQQFHSIQHCRSPSPWGKEKRYFKLPWLTRQKYFL